MSRIPRRYSWGAKRVFNLDETRIRQGTKCETVICASLLLSCLAFALLAYGCTGISDVVTQEDGSEALETFERDPLRDGPDLPTSSYVTSVRVEGDRNGKPYSIKSDGDQWFNTWADDGNIYATWSGGCGLKEVTDMKVVDSTWIDVGLTKLSGSFPGVSATEVWRDYIPPNFASRWPNAMKDHSASIICIDGTLYLALHVCGTPEMYSTAMGYIAKSADYGKTWARYGDSPWIWDCKGDPHSGSKFRNLMFVNMGKNYELRKDDYVYAFGIGMIWNWRQDAYLARVDISDAVGGADNIVNYDAWTYWTGKRWSDSEDDAHPLENVYAWEQFSAMYHPGIGRYLILTLRHLYEAPELTGPWSLVGGDTWVTPGWQGYQPAMIAKDAGKNSFWFTIAGQPWEPSNSDIAYNLHLGKMILELAE